MNFTVKSLYLCVRDMERAILDILKRKLVGVKIVFPLKRIGQNWVSEFEDSEGNHIELTAPYRKE